MASLSDEDDEGTSPYDEVEDDELRDVEDALYPLADGEVVSSFLNNV